MKRFVPAIIFAILISLFAACAAPEQQNMQKGDPDMTLEEMLEAVYKDVQDLPMTGNVALSDEISFQSYLFIPMIEGASALSGDALIGSIPHSVVLLRLPEGSDVQNVASQIEQNADPAKWICVEAEKVAVKTGSNTILLVMSTEEIADAVSANFDALYA